MTGGRRKLRHVELHNDHNKQDEMDGTCSKQQEYEDSMYYCGRKISTEPTIWKT